MKRALVLEDQDLMRLTIMEIVEEHYSGCNAEGARTLEAALAILHGNSFDLVVIDPGLPGFEPTGAEDRLSVVSQIVNASPNARHIVLTGSDSDSEALAMKHLGVDGYVAKVGLSRPRLKSLLSEISADTFSIHLADITIERRQLGLANLTKREQQIMEMMMDRRSGMKRKAVYEQMANFYKIDVSTAEQYFKSAVKKLRDRGHRLHDI